MLGETERQAGGPPQGECRKNPPVVVQADDRAVWPFLQDAIEGWCGAFERSDDDPSVN